MDLDKIAEKFSNRQSQKLDDTEIMAEYEKEKFDISKLKDEIYHIQAPPTTDPTTPGVSIDRGKSVPELLSLTSEESLNNQNTEGKDKDN